MAHIPLPEGFPGISAALAYRPDTAQPLMELAQILLRGASTLSAAERELIAMHVSLGNACRFCATSHAAAAAHLLGGSALVEEVQCSAEEAAISGKLKALLVIAGKVRGDARTVTPENITHARSQGATDREIHDTVLIAAAFSMYNRYVDGLATWTPDDPALYDAMGKRMAEQGYIRDRSKEYPRHNGE